MPELLRDNFVLVYKWCILETKKSPTVSKLVAVDWVYLNLIAGASRHGEIQKEATESPKSSSTNSQYNRERVCS